MISRRSLLASSLLIALPGRHAYALDYPSRLIRIVAAASPGSATDMLARHLAAELGEDFSQATVVENKVGAGGNIAIDFVANSPADGYTLLVVYSMLYTNPWIAKTNYDPVKDFEPVARVVSSGLVMVTGTASRFKSVQDVITAAKNQPKSISYGSAGTGTTSHMCGALLEKLAGIELTHIPYKAPAPAAIDAAAGIVDISFTGTATALSLIEGGRLRALAVTNSIRSPQLRDVPTLAETGVTDYELTSPIWVVAPSGTPHAVIDKLSEAIMRLGSTADFRELCTRLAIDVDLQPAAAYRASVPAELEKWRRLVALTKSES